jgi:predicted TIM-barrel fold metal-dependent hydrolase
VIVDFHCHLTPAEWARDRPIPPILTDVEGFLERKRADGIDVAVLCNAMLNLPGATVDNLSLEQIKAWNEFARGVVADSEGHVAASVGINPFGGPAMLEEMRAAVQSGDFRGVTINATVDGRHLGDPELEDFWSLAEELAVPILVHPSSSPPSGEVFSSPWLLEYGLRPIEVALSVASAILAGVLERHPGLVLVAGGGGGGLPMLLLRLDVPHRYGTLGPPTAKATTLPNPPSSFLSRVYADSCSLNEPTLRFNAETLGADHMLFGTDSPPLSVPASFSLDLVERLPITEASRHEVLGATAARLLRLPEP